MTEPVHISEADLPKVAPAPLAPTRGPALSDWLEANSRAVSILGGVALVAALGVVGYRWMERSKWERGDRALAQALGAAQAGPSGQSALRGVATSYRGTPAGAVAAMALAQSLYESGDYAGGVQVLDRADPDEANRDAVLALKAAGYEGAGRTADAAALYERVAGDAKDEARRGLLLASAARARAASGDNAAAGRLWARLDSAGGDAAAEARVRSGELEARASR